MFLLHRQASATRSPGFRGQLQRLDPFVIVKSELRARGSSLGGFMRLLMIPMLLAYIIVVIVQYNETPDVTTTSVYSASARIDEHLQVKANVELEFVFSSFVGAHSSRWSINFSLLT